MAGEKAPKALPLDNNFEASVGNRERLTIAVVVSASLGRELLMEWLREISGKIIVFRSAEELVRGDSQDLDLIVLGLCWESVASENILAMIRLICSEYEDVPVVAVVSDLAPGSVRDILGSGVKGIIPIRLPAPVAIAAVRLVLLGGIYAPPDIPFQTTVNGEKFLKDDPTEWTSATDLLAQTFFHLSPREAEVLSLLRVGCSNREIASKLAISENTVMVHVRHLMQKIGATNRTEAVFKANKIISELRNPQT